MAVSTKKKSLRRRQRQQQRRRRTLKGGGCGGNPSPNFERTNPAQFPSNQVGGSNGYGYADSGNNQMFAGSYAMPTRYGCMSGGAAERSNSCGMSGGGRRRRQGGKKTKRNKKWWQVGCNAKKGGMASIAVF